MVVRHAQGGGGLDLSSFFDYPTDGPSEATDELVFLGGWCEADWDTLLAHTEARVVRRGDDVYRAGDEDRALYLLTSGKVDLLLPRRDGRLKRFKSIAAPSVLGELSFVDGGPRSGTLRALEEGELRRLSLESFEVFSARYPELARAFLFEVAAILSQRLRRASDFIANGAG